MKLGDADTDSFPYQYNNITAKNPPRQKHGGFSLLKSHLLRRGLDLISSYLLFRAACAAASLAIGTRNGEQDT